MAVNQPHQSVQVSTPKICSDIMDPFLNDPEAMLHAERPSTTQLPPKPWVTRILKSNVVRLDVSTNPYDDKLLSPPWTLRLLHGQMNVEETARDLEHLVRGDKYFETMSEIPESSLHDTQNFFVLQHKFWDFSKLKPFLKPNIPSEWPVASALTCALEYTTTKTIDYLRHCVETYIQKEFVISKYYCSTLNQSRNSAKQFVQQMDINSAF